MKLGSMGLERGILLAPMEDVTDQAFRLVCKRLGADIVYTEFVPAEAIAREIPGIKEKLAFGEEERPFGVQIYGNRVAAMVAAAQGAAAFQPDILDINYGCPAKRVALGDETSCAGSGLLRFPDLLEELTAAVVEAMRPFGIPVTVKTRLGWDAETITILDTLERMERCGVQALTIHGRTRNQLFHGTADWSWIRRAKEAAQIPIIGNGDIMQPEDVLRMFEETGCDAVMIGRGAIGNPWIFRQARAYLNTGVLPPEPDIEERAVVYLEHLALAWASKGSQGVRQIRKHLKGYFRGFRNASDLRTRLMTFDEPGPIREHLMRVFPGIG
jgi:tRNA-dihydrouridine synthase B